MIMSIIDRENGHGSGITSESIGGPGSDSVTASQPMNTSLIINNAGIVSACQMYRITLRTRTSWPSLQVVSLSSSLDQVIGSEVDHE
ncbi:MAG: hypothetical protein A07HR60_01147 [uncultured archaeon A07HR60]|nr:MAG: hypothetical protein A07HR60_01147 [uncultured archaeon A07HR60]